MALLERVDSVRALVLESREDVELVGEETRISLENEGEAAMHSAMDVESEAAFGASFEAVAVGTATAVGSVVCVCGKRGRESRRDDVESQHTTLDPIADPTSPPRSKRSKNAKSSPYPSESTHSSRSRSTQMSRHGSGSLSR